MTEMPNIEQLLAWRHPFRMVDRLIAYTPHDCILTHKLVTANDPVLAGAPYPGTFFPGVLLLEGLSQTAALLFRLSFPETGSASLPLLGFLAARLHGSVRPGEIVAFDVQSEKMTRTAGVFRGEARNDSRVLATAELAFSASGDPS
jgi:3-hydroxyacyl-[acyl-carrier-protein] dehydratase